MNATKEGSAGEGQSPEPLKPDESLLRHQLNLAHYWGKRSMAIGEPLFEPTNPAAIDGVLTCHGN